jgi:UDP-2,3-diacylglucosamine pyrophosphatase LpxH
MRSISATTLVDQIEALTFKFGKQNDYDCLIMGHTHSPTCWTRDSFSYYNVGDWVQHQTALKITEDEMRLISYEPSQVIFLPIDKSWKSAARRNR